MGFFHTHANARRKKNFIHTVEHDGKVLVAEHSKAQAFLQFFDEVLGMPPSKSCSVNFQSLGLPHVNLLRSGDRFTEEEVWAIISSLPPDKASRPDGFTVQFLQVVCPIIHSEIMAAFNALWHLDTRNLHNINDSLLVMFPKSTMASSVKDYHPISLIHIIGKLLSKVLANRLAPRLGELVQAIQSVFIKGRVIQDNFKMIQLMTKLLHAQKKPNVLLKVNIAPAFDSVAWSFLLEILQHLGFSSHWCDWISALLSSPNTKVLLNGMLGDRICHAQGLR
jgi:hypothetical protein